MAEHLAELKIKNSFLYFDHYHGTQVEKHCSITLNEPLKQKRAIGGTFTFKLELWEHFCGTQ